MTTTPHPQPAPAATGEVDVPAGMTAGLVRTRPMRADARRNYERLLRAATDVFVEQGAGASLDEIARRAGVGPGTLYRHFPTRPALLEAVFLDRVELLAGQARDLRRAGESRPPAEVLLEWMTEFVEHVGTFRGLGVALMNENRAEQSPGRKACETDEAAAKGPLMAACHGVLLDAALSLLIPAQRAGTIRDDVTGSDLLKLANAVAVATEKSPDRAADAARYLSLLMDGMRNR